jgi:uncharacterized membrane protein
MLDRTYWQRLEADLEKWEADGVIAPAVGASIRIALPPLAPGINIPVVLGIVGGLLIAAAFLAFVAAHWAELARLARVAILFSGTIVAFGVGGWSARSDRPVIADLCAGVGSIIFGAGIALVGQMYHLGDDFAGGLLLWAVGALAAAVLTGSRGGLAVALVAGCLWSGSRILEMRDIPHVSFLVIWLIAAGLALAWNSRVAAHLVAAAFLPWWITAAIQYNLEPAFIIADGAALLFGVGLALAATPWQRTSSFGATLSSYGAFSLAIAAILEALTLNSFFHPQSWIAGQPIWASLCGITGTLLAFAAAAAARRAGIAFGAIAIALVLIAAAVWTPVRDGDPWLAYAFELSAMLCLVVSGMLDAARPRIVAGWIGIAGVIAGITWAVKGSLLRRSVFLAVAGAAAIVLATVLDRVLPRSDK